MRLENKRDQNEEFFLKNHVLQLEKTYFLYCSFITGPLELHFKADLQSLRRVPITF
jgi:hypothetical protein